VKILRVEEFMHLFGLFFVSEVDEGGLVDALYDNSFEFVKDYWEIRRDIE
jgi:hypothetical protein